MRVCNAFCGHLSETGRDPFFEFDTEAVQNRLPVPDRHGPFPGSIHDSQPDHLPGSLFIREHPVPGCCLADDAVFGQHAVRGGKVVS